MLKENVEIFPKTNYFPALTGIRAIAAYFVFFHHYNDFNRFKAIHDFANELHVGVTIFFVLSGFLIAYRYAEQRISFKKYFVNRFARIYPMYFLLTSCTFLVGLFLYNASTTHDFVIYLTNITFIRGFFDKIKFTGIAQGWSLTVEETFYFLAPLFFIVIKRKKYNLLLLPIGCLFTGLFFVFISSHLSLGSFFVSNTFMLNYTFFGRCFEFFIGISLALFFKRCGDAIKTRWCTYIGAIIIFLLIYFLSVLKNTGNYQFGIQHPFGLFINNFLLPLFGIALLFWGLLTEKTFISKILSSRVMILLGKSSYIFYLIHLGIFYTFVSMITQRITFVFILINLISIFLFLFVEEPLHKFFKLKLASK